MRFKDFSIRACANENNLYELVKWEDNDRYCFTLCFFEWKEKEQEIEMKCVGDRFLVYYEDGLNGFILKWIDLITFIKTNR